MQNRSIRFTQLFGHDIVVKKINTNRPRFIIFFKYRLENDVTSISVEEINFKIYRGKHHI